MAGRAATKGTEVKKALSEVQVGDHVTNGMNGGFVERIEEVDGTVMFHLQDTHWKIGGKPTDMITVSA